MEIGATNISVLIGPYVSALATATENFGIPYFVMAGGTLEAPRPPNTIYVFPSPADINKATIEMIKAYEWTHVAIVYSDKDGIVCVLIRLVIGVDGI